MKTRQLTKDCKPIVEQCNGCNKVFDIDNAAYSYCLAYANPALFWRIGDCNLASHTIKTDAVGTSRKRIGQQKQRNKQL